METLPAWLRALQVHSLPLPAALPAQSVPGRVRRAPQQVLCGATPTPQQ